MKKKFMAAVLALIIGLTGLSTAFAATTPYVESDTTVSFSRPQNETYQVKFTVYGTHENPNITAGNGSVIQTQSVKKAKDKSGNDVYYFKVKATGKVGSTSAIYTTLPGQSAVRHFILTVSKPAAKSTTSTESTSIKLVQGAGTVGRGYTASLSIKGKPNTDYTLTVYYPSGPSKAAGVGTTTSDSSGNASWSWKVGTRTTPGSHSITISGGGQTLETSFTTT